MKTRISAMICLLCVFGYSNLTRAEDPSSQRVQDPYALSQDLPNMSSGTIEPYLSFMAGVSIPRSTDITFTDGVGPGPSVEKNVDYQMKQSIGGNAGIWFPTRTWLAGFDLGGEITGFVWYPDIACCRDGVNGTLNTTDGSFEGTTTEMQGIYIGFNLMTRYPMGISEAYPNGRWFPYVGVGGGAHQMSMRPGGFRGTGFANAIADQRDTAPGFLAVGGVKAHLFKYVAAFVEAKYVQAFHDALLTDRYGSSSTDIYNQSLVMNPYEATIRTIFVHAGLSIHFDIRP